MESEIRRCRLCLGEEVRDHSLFQIFDHNGISLSTKIIFCTSLMVSKDDLYSDYICNHCVDMIELFYEFRSTCLKTHIAMFNVINESPQSDFLLQAEGNKENNCILTQDNEADIPENCNSLESTIHLESVKNGPHLESFPDKTGNESLKVENILPEEIDMSEDSHRRFQVGCYVPVIDVENSRDTELKDAESLHRRFKCMNCKKVYGTLAELDNHWDICGSSIDNSEYQMNGFDQGLVFNGQSNEVYYEENAVDEAVEGEYIINSEEYKPRKRGTGREFCCESCGQVFKQLLLLKRHIQVKHVCVRPYSCTHCPRKFFDKYELKYHQRLHEDVEDFCCNICKRRFARRSGLKAHMRSHTGEKPFECKLCNKSFAHLNSLIAHERVHTGERPYLCSYCPRTFAQYSTAKSHEEMHMGGLRMFQCEICDRMYRTGVELSRHRLSHEGLHDHKCLVCDRGFKKQSELNKHNQRYHCDNKPFPCNQCDKSYISQRELKLHETVHTGELPFTCLLCSKSYRLKATLRRHMYKHHQGTYLVM